MFWNRFFDECSKKGTSPNAVCKAIGLSNATATGWKNGTLPKADVLVKIADHLNVSVDYLLGREESTRDMVYEHSDADDDASVKEELMELLGFDGKKEEHKIGIDLGTTYSFDGKKITPDDIRSIKYEPIIVKASEAEWMQILNRLSPESLVKLRDYTRFLLWLQDQAAEDSLKSRK